MSQATRLRQQVYGEDHPITTKSLDFFTVIYGEVGRFQYSGKSFNILCSTKRYKLQIMRRPFV